MIVSAGIIVVRREDDAWKYLFLRAYRNWDFPKGEVEEGEDPLTTAIRETKEETGISGLQFIWGNVFKETEPYKRGTKVARFYVAATSQKEVVFGINPEIGGPEHHEYQWLSYSEIEQLAPARLQPVIHWAHELLGG